MEAGNQAWVPIKTSMKTVYALAPYLTLNLNRLGITRKAYECGIKLELSFCNVRYVRPSRFPYFLVMCLIECFF